MLKNKISEKDRKEAYKSNKKVIRICETCGKEDELKFRSYFDCHKYRNLEGDFCVSCRMKKYFSNNPKPIGEDNKCWKGGICSTNGYKFVSVRDVDGKVRNVREHRYIYSNFLNRKLLPIESVHHIDMDKINNNIENLYLYNIEIEHRKAHRLLDKAVLSLLGERVWFDREKCEYVLDFVEDFYIDCPHVEVEYDIKYRKYDTLVYAYINVVEEKRQQLLHSYIAEKILKRKLYRNECVHHIDGDTLNNEVKNLQVMTTKQHTSCHKSIQRCATELYKQGVVGFNREDGKYFIVEK